MSRLWVVPLLVLAGGVGLSFATIAIDRSAGYDLLPQSITGTPTAAQSTLQLIAQSVVSLASIVLSLTLVAVQLAMGQFSPRIVRALLSDRRSQVAIGLFLATFAFAVLGMREIDDQAPGGGNVPGVTVVTAYVLAIANVVALLFYVHHAGQSLRVAALIDLVGDETRAQLDRVYPEELEHPSAAEAPGVVPSERSGVVVCIEHERLVEIARRAGCVIEVIPAMGDFVPQGAPLLRIHSSGATLSPPPGLTSHIEIGDERTHIHDPAYGFRKLVDMAERATSDPFDDPTTAVQAIDRLHDCLRLLARRRLPPGRWSDELGELRLVTRALDWEGYVTLVFDEIRLAGAGSPQVARRLRAALLDVRGISPAERRGALDRQLRLLDAAVRRAYEDDGDVERAMIADQQGIGSGPDLIFALSDTSGDGDRADPARMAGR